MNRLSPLAVALLGAAALAEPEVQIDCPGGMHFVKDKGCVANVAACPGGTRFEGGKCVAIIDTSCPAGMQFVAGTGCVATAAKSPKAAPAKTQEPSAPPPPP